MEGIAILLLSRKTGGWNLNGSLIIDQDSVAEDANVSERSSVEFNTQKLSCLKLLERLFITNIEEVVL